MRIGREPWYLVAGIYVIAYVCLDLLTGFLHPSPGISPWYPGAGLTVTLFYRFGIRYAPALVVAEAVRWSISHTTVSLLAVCMVGVALAVVYGTAVWLLRDRFGIVLPSKRVRDALWFCGLGVVPSAFAAAASVGVLVAFGEFPASAFWPIAKTFWLGDAIGILAVAPIADLTLSMIRAQVPSTYRRRIPLVPELIAVAATAACAGLAFGVLKADPARLAAFAVTFVPVALLATREGLRGAILGVATFDVTIVAVDAITHPGAHVVLWGQTDALVQSILAFILGAFATSRTHYRDFSRWVIVHDLRTTLPNRIAFDDWVDGEHSGQFWVACIDLDHFSSVDAGMDRVAADALLRAAAERIAEAVPVPEFFGRFESDAFVLARAGTRDDAVTYAHRIIAAFREPLPAASAVLRFSVSIGVAAGIGREARALLTEAISAMREAKTAGGNQLVVFEPPPGLARGARLAAELVRARDHGEFLLHYQPIHDLTAGTVVGFEALLRWQHPELGLLRPGAFLPALSRSALLDEIEAWVVHEAAAALARLGAGRGRRVWINLSGRAAFDDAFIDQIPAIARSAGTRADRLVVEVTEQVVAASERIGEITRRLYGLGIGVAVDDFGTGHSNLERVRAAHVDYLKLDRSFVSAVTESERAYGVALAMLSVAERIRAAAVAEGLETASQINAFREAGCRLGQGYALSEPMDEAALRAFLA
ncbi:MAG TPA: EAL domain-containing protein [Candidatus Elarobacter sp.]